MDVGFSRSTTVRRSRSVARRGRHDLASGAFRRVAVSVLAIAGTALLAGCGSPAAPGAGLPSPTIDAVRATATPTASGAERLAPGLWRLGGAEAGTLLRADATGLVVVAGERSVIDRSAPGRWLRAAGLSGPPVEAVILPRAVPAQVEALAGGVDLGAPVIVQQRVAERIGAGTPPRAGRLIGYENDHLLRAGGFEVETEHVGRGRTGSDSVVLFRDLQVLAIGDLYTRDVPEPDRASGGTLEGWAAAITHLLWFDFEIAVPSRGAPVDRRELVAFRNRLTAMAASAAPAQGVRR